MSKKLNPILIDKDIYSNINNDSDILTVKKTSSQNIRNNITNSNNVNNDNNLTNITSTGNTKQDQISNKKLTEIQKDSDDSDTETKKGHTYSYSRKGISNNSNFNASDKLVGLGNLGNTCFM